MVAFVSAVPGLLVRQATTPTQRTDHRAVGCFGFKRRVFIRSCAQGADRTDFSSNVTAIATERSAQRKREIWDVATLLFPAWAVAAAALALARPDMFTRFTDTGVMRRMLSLLMLSMGLTLTGGELLGATKRPWLLLFALLCCYLMMPALAVLLAQVFRLTGADATGLVLLGLVSGGQASNLCTLIAGGDVALSVAMTTVTSAVSVIAVPWLSAFLLGKAVAVNAVAVGWSTVELVGLPLLLGVGLNTVFPKVVGRLKGVLPVVGMVTVLMLIVGPVAQNAGLFMGAAQRLGAAVMVLHIVGGIIGYAVPRLFGSRRRTAVTTGFEAGFKSPVLSFVLAIGHFGEATGLASVVSIVVLAPVAALFAVLLRLNEGGNKGGNAERTRGREVTRDGWRSPSREEWMKGFSGMNSDMGHAAAVDNTRALFRVVGQDGQTKTVDLDRLGTELQRTRRRCGIHSVQRLQLP